MPLVSKSRPRNSLLSASTGHKTPLGANLRPQPLTCSRNFVTASRHHARNPEQKSADRLQLSLKSSVALCFRVPGVLSNRRQLVSCFPHFHHLLPGCIDGAIRCDPGRVQPSIRAQCPPEDREWSSSDSPTLCFRDNRSDSDVHSDKR